uniref:Putative secreted protein n=1 Tax=Ixodes scapularis TaxID=6945 RepID=A0A4D5RSD4_IXOSC
MTDFLTTAFPVILILVARGRDGPEQRLPLYLSPEFKNYNVSMWRVHGSECSPRSAHFIKWKQIFVESTDTLRYDELLPGRYCFMLNPVTRNCYPPGFCSRRTSKVVEIRGSKAMGKECCYEGKLNATFIVEHEARAVHVDLRMRAPSNPCLTRFVVSIWPTVPQASSCAWKPPSGPGHCQNEVLPNKSVHLYNIQEGPNCIRISTSCESSSYNCPDVLLSSFTVEVDTSSIWFQSSWWVPVAAFLSLWLLCVVVLTLACSAARSSRSHKNKFAKAPFP